ncbi:hypothetical protein [Neptunomonas qingdaonensis]|uniref:Uncharacterized protein n=1 Tax=Neptunomonas qingdaonensis TaxID=1045558 RepID=A0A1I2PDK9_9GAMM|nr:hypothetical protein [Neptunomonas qingdaonensis]SFG14154.1 hypothetical protein SAMN05216175_103402 [Neptunomonas qingdaonensis]
MDFLQNLMIRHQTETTQPIAGLHRAAVIVQPRQKLRFESGSESLMPAADMSQANLSDAQIPEESADLRPLTAAVFEELDREVARDSEYGNKNIDRDINKSLHKSADKGTNEPLNKLSAKAGGNESGLDHPAMEPIGQMPGKSASMSRASLPANEQHLIQASIQSGMQLDMQQGLQPNAKNSIPGSTQNSIQHGVLDRNQKSTLQNKLHSAQSIAGFMNTPQHVLASQLTSSPAPLLNSGLLQTPDWLSQIQADLQDRWQELNQQAQAEPVINVTIGRVEVRAVRADSPQPPRKKSALPSGVMTLDSYLKQRDSRGPV